MLFLRTSFTMVFCNHYIVPNNGAVCDYREIYWFAGICECLESIKEACCTVGSEEMRKGVTQVYSLLLPLVNQWTELESSLFALTIQRPQNINPQSVNSGHASAPNTTLANTEAQTFVVVVNINNELLRLCRILLSMNYCVYVNIYLHRSFWCCWGCTSRWSVAAAQLKGSSLDTILARIKPPNFSRCGSLNLRPLRPISHHRHTICDRGLVMNINSSTPSRPAEAANATNRTGRPGCSYRRDYSVTFLQIATRAGSILHVLSGLLARGQQLRSQVTRASSSLGKVFLLILKRFYIRSNTKWRLLSPRLFSDGNVLTKISCDTSHFRKP